MNKFLKKISDDFALTRNAITQKFAWIGTSGGGKSYAATEFAESLWDAGGQFVVLDPVGIWYGLRLDKSGKKPSHINIPVFGGLHGDVPIEPASGALIADLIIDRDICAIIDVSQFEFDTDKARFATAFAARFFFRKKSAPSAVHVFLEECQEFVPQVPQRGEEKMLHEFTRMQKIGRNFGIGMSLITQRPQEVSKRVLNLSGTLFAFRTIGAHERDAVERWMKDIHAEDDFLNNLPKLETGCPHVWSPEYLKMSKVVKILPKQTFDASATPEIGAKSVVRNLAPIDLEKIKTQMAATIEKLKKDDPKAMQAEILQLKKKISDLETKPAKAAAPATVEIKTRVEVPVFKDSQVKRLGEIFRKMQTEADRHGKAMAMFWKNFDDISQTMVKALDTISAYHKASGTRIAAPAIPATRVGARVIPVHPQKAENEQVPAQATTDGQITGPERRILDAVAWAETIMKQPSNSLIAFLSGYTNPKSTGYTNPRGTLAAKGLVQYPVPGTVILTESGRQVAAAPESAMTQHELHEQVLKRLTGPQARILKILLDNGGNPITNQDLSAGAGYTNPKSTGYTNPRGELRSYGLIDYTPEGVKAADILFI